jgi:hypothetical protein
VKRRRRPARHGRAGTSRCRRGHLASDEHVNLAAVILVIRKALIDLGAGDVREAASYHAIHRFPILEEADDIMNADERALNNGVAAAHALLARDVAITDVCHVFVHTSKHT